MARITVTPKTAAKMLTRISAGDEVVFGPGLYSALLDLRGLIGSHDHPIVLRAEPGAVITTGISAEAFREEANRRSKQLEIEGKFPGLYPWFEDGRLVLTRCRHVTITGFRFEQSWPTHIALDSCQDITISECDFLDATFAISALGESTRGITIEHCTWMQDRKPGRMWHEIPWRRIHGAPPDDPLVDIENDWRLFDGDFFRGFGIAGDVTVRHCEIEHCFNAIHIFNDDRKPHLGRNVHVHDCVFSYVRDNVFEPEMMASNWWFHNNRLFNVHKWFSCDCKRSDYFYLFGNLAWFDSVQGPDEGDGNRGGGVFKLTKKHVSVPFGPHYVFHNSFATRSDYMRKGIFAGLKHFNNAVHCVRQTGDNRGEWPRFFGEPKATGAGHAEKRFTMDWGQFGIEMSNDVVGHPDWPKVLRRDGYDIGKPRWRRDPGFVNPLSDDLSGEGLRLGNGSPRKWKSGGRTIVLPDGEVWEVPDRRDVGAWQDDGLYQGPAYRPLAERIL